MAELANRKPNRLSGYDYSQNGSYFITVCAKDRAELFSHIITHPPVGAVANRPSPVL